MINRKNRSSVFMNNISYRISSHFTVGIVSVRNRAYINLAYMV